jgi:hypothetical protein
MSQTKLPPNPPISVAQLKTETVCGRLHVFSVIQLILSLSLMYFQIFYTDLKCLPRVTFAFVLVFFSIFKD